MKMLHIVNLLALLFGTSLSSMPTDQMAATNPPQGPGPDTIEHVEKIGLQGNWVKKREWLVKANEVNYEIQDVALQSEQIRKTFITRYNQIDNDLDAYYKELGLQEGKIQELFDSIQRYLNKKKKKDASSLDPGAHPDSDLQAKIDLLEDSIKLSKQQMEQLRLDLKSIDDLHESLEDRIKKLDEQINLIHEEAVKAKTITNDMWSIIDHSKARLLYYDLKNAILETIKNTQSYLREDLSKDFDTVIETIKTQMVRVKEGVKKLEDEGIFVKNRAQRIKELKLKELQTRQESIEKQVATVKLEVAKAKPRTWTESVYDWILSIASKIYSTWQWVISKISGPKTQAQPIGHPIATQTQPMPANAPANMPTLPTTAAMNQTAVPAIPVAQPMPTEQPLADAQKMTMPLG
jgi:hypothetical protein